MDKLQTTRKYEGNNIAYNNNNMTMLNKIQTNYNSYDNLDRNKNLNNINIKNNSRTSDTLIPTKSSQTQNENIKQCPYCNLEFENHEFINHIYIHESHISLFTNSEQCCLLSEANAINSGDTKTINLTAPNSIMISNNNELPNNEHIFDPASDFEFIDKKEVERLMKEDRLRESTNSKKITFNKLSEVISNSLQVKSKNVLKPKKKSQGGCKSAIAVLGDGLEYK